MKTDPAVPDRIPEGFVQGNWYARQLFERLFAVADAARHYYEIARPEGIQELEARLALRWALKRLDGDE